MELAQARKARITPRLGGRILADALVAQGIDHVFSVPGEIFPRHARRPVRRAPEVEAGHLPVRGRGGEHGRGLRQADRPSGGGDGDARSRRLPWRDRRAHRDAGQHAVVAVRRPDPARGHRPRRVPGDRLSPHVRLGRQMGDADRPDQAHPGNRCARGRCRDLGPAGSGGDRAVRRDAARNRGGRGPAARAGHPAHPDPAAFATLRAMLGRARKPLAVLGGSCWSAAGRSAIRDFLLANDIPVATGLPPPGAVRRDAGQFRRRSRRRLRSGADRAR